MDERKIVQKKKEGNEGFWKNDYQFSGGGVVRRKAGGEEEEWLKITWIFLDFRWKVQKSHAPRCANNPHRLLYSLESEGDDDNVTML